MQILSIIFFILILFINNISFAKTIIGKAKIIDGDTIHIDKNKIRLHGIDAPETKQKCLIDSEEWFCGKHSTNELKKLINDQVVKCIVKDIDIYNRFVAVCLIDTIDLNRLMVMSGWAVAYRYYSTDYIIEENFARDRKLGIWKSQFLKPHIFRKQNRN